MHLFHKLIFHCESEIKLSPPVKHGLFSQCLSAALELSQSALWKCVMHRSPVLSFLNDFSILHGMRHTQQLIVHLMIAKFQFLFQPVIRIHILLLMTQLTDGALVMYVFPSGCWWTIWLAGCFATCSSRSVFELVIDIMLIWVGESHYKMPTTDFWSLVFRMSIL